MLLLFFFVLVLLCAHVERFSVSKHTIFCRKFTLNKNFTFVLVIFDVKFGHYYFISVFVIYVCCILSIIK